MAYVAISRTLLDDVQYHINMMRNAELSQFPEPAPFEHTIPTITPELEAAMWGEHLDAKSKLPAEWLPVLKGVHLRDGVGNVLRINTQTSFRSRPLPVSAGTCFDGYVSIKLNESMTHWWAIAELRRQWRKQTTEISDRWKENGSKVRQFLENSKSLNEAVKLWPEVRLYIPQRYLDRVEQKSEKQEREASKAMEILKTLDTDTLVAAAVGARMAGASAQ